MRDLKAKILCTELAAHLPSCNACEQDLYDACPGWGWSDAKKRAELSHPEARYLIVYEQQAQQDGSTSQASSDAAAATEAGQAAGSGGASAAAEAAAAAEPATEAATEACSGGAAEAEAAEASAAASAAAAVPAGQENSAAAGNGGGQGLQAAAEAGLGQPVAFVHYRFEEEAGEAVLYCYEIHVAQAVQVRHNSDDGAWVAVDWRVCIARARRLDGWTDGPTGRQAGGLVRWRQLRTTGRALHTRCG